MHKQVSIYPPDKKLLHMWYGNTVARSLYNSYQDAFEKHHASIAS